MNLSTFNHAYRTNVSKNVINNQDATLLVLHTLGGVAKLGQIKERLQEWRPGVPFNYLFNTSPHGGYGFVGETHITSHHQMINQKEHGVSGRAKHYHTHTFNRRTYWHRIGHGTYSLTLEGMKRLRELGITS